MARKRIKTLASEWGFPVEDLLAGCARLKLGHTQSESSLLSPEEADRLKADLDDQAHRATILRRETVLETSSGKILEKRLNATVMRRRHAEGGAAAGGRHAFPFRSRRESRRFVHVAVSRRFTGGEPRRRSCSIRGITRTRRRSSRIARPSRCQSSRSPKSKRLARPTTRLIRPRRTVHLKDAEPEPEPEVVRPSRSLPPVVVEAAPAPEAPPARRRRRRRASVTGPIACARRRRRSAARST